MNQYVGFDEECLQCIKAFAATKKKKGKQIKFGSEVPRNVKHALEIDKENGNKKWQEAMKLEVSQLFDFNVFRVLEDGEPVPEGFTRIPHQIVFDVKFDGRLKARLVGGGHRTPEVHHEEVFSSVVSMEAVRLGFLIAKLNNLQVCAGDIGNAFLNGTTREKLYIVAGPEFGPELEGKRLNIVKSLYVYAQVERDSTNTCLRRFA